jgi:hypothetical protein
MFNSPTPNNKTIQEHEAILTDFQKFIALVNDPDKIKAAHEEHRKACTLTAEQEAKYKAALETIEKAEEVKADIAGQKKDLQDDQELHETNVREWRKLVDGHTDEHGVVHIGEKACLAKQKEEQDGVTISQANERKRLDADWADMQAKFKDAMKPIEDMKKQAEKDSNAAAKEKEKQEKITAKLNAKLKRVSKAASDEDDDNEEV